MNINEEFRQKGIEAGQTSLDRVMEYIEGKIDGNERVAAAIKVFSLGVKLEHMNQLKVQNDRSFALRLIRHIPQDEETRMKYIEMTNPDLKPLLLDRPKK